MSLPVFLVLTDGIPYGTFSSREKAACVATNLFNPEIKLFQMKLWDTPTRCDICHVWLLYDSVLNSELVHCSLCHSQWDGNAQCRCADDYDDYEIKK